MNTISQHLAVDQLETEKLLNFLPYPFLVSILQDGVQRNIFVNKKFQEELGYSCEEIPTIDDWFDKAYPDKSYRAGIIDAWAENELKAQEHSEDFVLLRAKIHTKKSGDLWYEVKASVSEPLRLVAFVNINDEIVREQELKRLNDNKNRTLSILSHDLRMPLNNLYSLAQLSIKGIVTQDEYVQYLKSISDKTFNLLQFLETTLEWTQSNFNQIQPVIKKVRIARAIEDVIKIFEPNCRAKGIEVKISPNEFPDLFTDEKIVSIVFRNIFSNAIKFSGNGLIYIQCIRNNSHYCISIKDCGVGMTSEKISSLLSGNYQSERGTNQEKGLGFGIKLCMDLLTKINGDLKIESEPLHGTTVFVLLQDNAHLPEGNKPII